MLIIIPSVIQCFIQNLDLGGGEGGVLDYNIILSSLHNIHRCSEVPSTKTTPLTLFNKLTKFGANNSKLSFSCLYMHAHGFVIPSPSSEKFKGGGGCRVHRSMHIVNHKLAMERCVHTKVHGIICTL